MARGKKPGQTGRTRRPDTPPGHALPPAPDTDEGASIFDNMRDDAYAVVWWVDPAGKHRVQFQVAPHMLSEEYIMQMCGGGTYVIREKVPDESGRMEWGRQRRIIIDGPHKVLKEIPPYVPRQTPGQHPAAPVPGQRVGLDDVMTAGILNLLKHQQDANQAVLAAIKPQGSGVLEMLTVLAPVLEKLAEGFAGRQQEKRSGISDIKEVADIMKSLKEAAGAPASPANEYLDLINRVLKVKKTLDRDDEDGGKDDSSTPTERVLERMAGPLVSFLESRAGTQPAATAAAKQITDGKGRQPVSAVEDLFLTTQKKRLLSLAMRNKDAETLALGDYEALPETYLGPLKTWLGKENVFEELMQKVPEFQQYHDWFSLYFETLHREFFPELYDDDETLEEGVDDEAGDEAGAAAATTGASDAAAVGTAEAAAAAKPKVRRRRAADPAASPDAGGPAAQ